MSRRLELIDRKALVMVLLIQLSIFVDIGSMQAKGAKIRYDYVKIWREKSLVNRMEYEWIPWLRINPLPTLLSTDNFALIYFVKRDLFGEVASPVNALWEMPDASSLIGKQQTNGAWRYPGKSYDPQSGTNYNLLETYRILRRLVEMYGFHRDHPAIQKAAEYLFTCQTKEGDIRGILGNQYMPYYHGAMLELLIKAGYAEDARVIDGLTWLLTMRQADGGWVVPAQTVTAKQKTNAFWLGEPIRALPSKPSSHLATGMVLRAFAAHPEYRHRPEVVRAGQYLRSRIFQPDKYNDRKAPSYWFKFQYPFWWASLLTSLDTLSWLGFDHRDEQVAKGLNWFLDNQAEDGLWGTGYGSGRHAENMRQWVGLAICRVFKRFLS